jgi:RecA/RadA recombinase
MPESTMKKQDKKYGPKNGAAGDNPAAELPDVLARGGAVEARLDAAEKAAREDDGQLAVIQDLREALAGLRGVCEAAVGGRSLDPARRDRRCARALAEMPGRSEDAARLLRLVVLVQLADEPTDELWTAGVAAYRKRRAVYDTVLGGGLLGNVRRDGAYLDFQDNANPTALDDWSVFAHQLQEQRQAPRPGMTTGLADLDDRTGGLSEFTLLAGEPASGKSSLGLQLAAGAIRASPAVAVLYVDLEMGKQSQYLRLLSRESGIPLPRIVTKDRTADDNAAVQAADKRLRDEVLPRLRVVDLASAHRDTVLTRQWFRQELERLLSIAGVERCLVVVDSINRVRVEDAVQSYEDDGPTRFQRLSEMDALKARLELLLEVQRMTRAVAGPAGFPVLAVARCRKPDRRGSPELTDLYGGVDLGYDAQSVYLLERHEAADPSVTPVTLKLAKVRQWGSEGEIELDFHHTVSTFRPRDRPPPSAAARPATKKARFSGRS